MASGPIIDKLPRELLIQIFEEVSKPLPDGSNSHNAILSCLLCCRRWHDVAQQVLYHEVVLYDKTFKPFIQTFSPPFILSPNRPLEWTKSLTIYVDALGCSITPEGERLHPSPEEVIAYTNQTVLPLHIVPPILLQMPNLTTFSMIVMLGCCDYDAPAELIGRILSALPSSCVNLELDIDHVGFNAAGTGLAHVCEVLAKILPRLHDLRLSMGPICPALLCPKFDREGGIPGGGKPFVPPVFPHLRSLVINLSDFGNTSPCTEDRLEPPNDSEGTCVSMALPIALRQLCLLGSFPVIRHLWLVQTNHDQCPRSDDLSLYDSLMRRNIVTGKTLLMPHVDLPGANLDEHCYMMRTLDGRQLISNVFDALVKFTEGYAWQETLSGTRLPSAVLAPGSAADQRHAIIEDEIASFDGGYKAHPHGSCALWDLERMTGHRLIWAVERDQLVDVAPLHEWTPPGWKRVIGDNGEIGPLVPDDAPN
ncbi:hypothetical protein NUU61_006592 [Penicillium alfredii]|uniref:F-box domain-containing protein n=1 Tax=Penicillium alfredii TaxID=1506179 RepID=A0A9W9F182_9EURO|nr:uncharacterized protein NUU61_006592 [Penicillium alfredii]KAJ5091722.1 hypothetical protein NUU61_006592 [Penicillium alfredii]